MGRTALNVNGSITTGLLTKRFLGDEVEDTLPDMAAQGLQEN
jgi:L-cystine uptake protein TcyP (sodium:dicarboxylate symporter family)